MSNNGGLTGKDKLNGLRIQFGQLCSQREKAEAQKASAEELKKIDRELTRVSKMIQEAMNTA